MANPVYFPGDVQIQGTLYAVGFTPPALSISDAQIAAAAAIAASKVIHQHRAFYAQGSGTTAAAATQVIYVGYGTTAAAIDFKAGAIVANIGAATCTVDLKKNGSSILGAVITLNNTQTARQLVTATISN